MLLAILFRLHDIANRLKTMKMNVTLNLGFKKTLMKIRDENTTKLVLFLSEGSTIVAFSLNQTKNLSGHTFTKQKHL